MITIWSTRIAIVAVIVALLLAAAGLSRTRDAAHRNCVAIEIIKAQIVQTVQASHGLTEPDKQKAYRRFAALPCR